MEESVRIFLQLQDRTKSDDEIETLVSSRQDKLLKMNDVRIP